MINLTPKTSLKKSMIKDTSFTLSPKKWLRRYRENETGIAAIEFAIIAPIMIGMYFGLAEVATAISVDRRISHGTNIAADLVTQLPAVDENEMTEIIAAAIRVMEVQNPAGIHMQIESFILPSAGQPATSLGRIFVNDPFDPSQPDDPNDPTDTDNPEDAIFEFFNPASLDPTLLNETSGIVVARAKYEYETLNLRYLDSTITFEETFRLKPRASDSVAITPTIISCEATSFKDVTCS